MGKVTIAIALVYFLFFSCSTPTETAIKGAWKVEQFARKFSHPDSAWTIITYRNASLYIFSDKYYGYSYVRGSNPRTLFEGDPNRPGDAEKIAAYDSFVANSGIYSLNDSILTLKAILNKNPNEMIGRSLSCQIKIEKNRMEITTTNPPFLPGHEWRTSLLRVE
jgi:hypothetical protein